MNVKTLTQRKKCVVLLNNSAVYSRTDDKVEYQCSPEKNKKEKCFTNSVSNL